MSVKNLVLVDDVLRLHRRGDLSLRRLGALVGVSGERVRQILVRAGALDRYGRPQFVASTSDQEVEPHLEDVRSGRISARKAADKVSLSYKTVLRSLHRLGLSHWRRTPEHGTCPRYAGGCRCRPCRQANADRAKRLASRYRDAGLCACGGERARGKLTCRLCLEKRRRYANERSGRYRLGLCTTCGKRAGEVVNQWTRRCRPCREVVEG